MILNLFNKSKDELYKLNTEYENLKLRNDTESKKIRSSINEKSNKFKHERESRKKHFDVIRNK